MTDVPTPLPGNEGATATPVMSFFSTDNTAFLKAWARFVESLSPQEQEASKTGYEDINVDNLITEI